jgi:hypothetical protein
MEVVRTPGLVPHDVPAFGIVTVADAILLAVSVAAFIYLGIAIFLPERF